MTGSRWFVGLLLICAGFGCGGRSSLLPPGRSQVDGSRDGLTPDLGDSVRFDLSGRSDSPGLDSVGPDGAWPDGSHPSNLDWDWSGWKYVHSAGDGASDLFELEAIADGDFTGQVGNVGFRKDGTGRSSFGYAEKSFQQAAAGLRMWLYQSPSDLPQSGYAQILVDGSIVFQRYEAEWEGTWSYIDVPFGRTLHNFTVRIGKWHTMSWGPAFYVSCANLSFY